MSVAVRPSRHLLEFEINDARNAAVHYLEHGFPSPLVRWHCHEDYEVHLIVASSGKCFVGDYLGEFDPGQLVMTGPNLPHNWISQIDEGAEVPLRDMVVQFRRDLIPLMADIAPEVKQLLPLLERSQHGIDFKGVDKRSVRKKMETIRDTDRAGRVGALLTLLHELAGETDYTQLSTMPIVSEFDDANHYKVERVIKFMMENYSRDLPLSEAADLVSMSESAFSRFFAKSTGNSFTRFLTRIRVSKACDLLSDSDEPITEICFSTGFNNVANFNRRFRELKLVTPREYRKQSRERHQ